MMTYKEKLKALIELFDNLLSDPQNSTELNDWMINAEHLADTMEFTNVERVYVDIILNMYKEQFNLQLETRIRILPNTEPINTPLAKEYLDEIINRKQTQQRTPEWYEQMSNIISASEIYNLFGTEYARYKMVISKTTPYVQKNKYLAVQSNHMSAFDWGIRFEPVVKQIYEYKYNAIIKDLGRLVHLTYNKCSASPDGLIYDSSDISKIGHLVEIKCPVTRKINGIIPKEYYCQMQMQLQVTQLDKCVYLEAVFSSKYNNNEERIGPSLYNGYIAIINNSTNDTNTLYYIYSPLNVAADWKPELKENEEIMEIVYWRLFDWHEQIVAKNDNWWITTKPLIETFWKDVEKAKRGELPPVESKRANKRIKYDNCIITFNKLGESSESPESPESPENTDKDVEQNTDIDI
jgi:hypothetical protein